MGQVSIPRYDDTKFLRNARVNPKLSAWEYLFGCYNFKATPIAPPRMKMVVHQKPTQRGSWDPHGITSFHIGPAMEHYRCFKCYIPSTKAERITDTVTFLPHNNIQVPNTTPAEGIKQALQDIVTLLQKPSTNLPFTTMGDETVEAIKKVQEIFEKQIHNNQIEKRSYEQLSQDFYSKNIPNKYKLPPPTNLPIFPQSKLHKTDLSRVHKTNFLNNILATESMNIQPIYPVVNHIYDSHGKRETIDTLRSSHQKDIWEKALSNEWGHLAQGNCHGVIPTNTISFIQKTKFQRIEMSHTHLSYVIIDPSKWNHGVSE